jgi:hypothetical protein
MPGSIRVPLEVRFWRYVDKKGDDECWPWTGNKVNGGYGHIAAGGQGGRMLLAHRVSLQWHLGRPIGEGLVCRHKCDTPLCVNPAHLEEGTQAENIHDTVMRGRAGRKLKAEDIPLIRLAALTETHTAIAVRFGVSHSMISSIIRGKFWSHIPLEVASE